MDYVKTYAKIITTTIYLTVGSKDCVEFTPPSGYQETGVPSSRVILFPSDTDSVSCKVRFIIHDKVAGGGWADVTVTGIVTATGEECVYNSTGDSAAEELADFVKRMLSQAASAPDSVTLKGAPKTKVLLAAMDALFFPGNSAKTKAALAIAHLSESPFLYQYTLRPNGVSPKEFLSWMYASSEYESFKAFKARIAKDITDLTKAVTAYLCADESSRVQQLLSLAPVYLRIALNDDSKAAAANPVKEEVAIHAHMAIVDTLRCVETLPFVTVSVVSLGFVVVRVRGQTVLRVTVDNFGLDEQKKQIATLNIQGFGRMDSKSTQVLSVGGIKDAVAKVAETLITEYK